MSTPPPPPDDNSSDPPPPPVTHTGLEPAPPTPPNLSGFEPPPDFGAPPSMPEPPAFGGGEPPAFGGEPPAFGGGEPAGLAWPSENKAPAAPPAPSAAPPAPSAAPEPTYAPPPVDPPVSSHMPPPAMNVEPIQPPEPTPDPALSAAEDVQVGRVMAYLSYASMFTGLPLFLIPFLQRDNDFALYHARQAAVIFVSGFVIASVFTLLTTITCGFGVFLLPVVFLPWIPTVHGFLLASEGKTQEPVGLMGLADRLLGNVTADQKKR